jgi:hypothetical protein
MTETRPVKLTQDEINLLSVLVKREQMALIEREREAEIDSLGFRHAARAAWGQIEAKLQAARRAFGTVPGNVTTGGE